MNTALWIIQIILGIKLLSVSYSHGLRQSQPTMRESIRKMGSLAKSLHFLIAICTFAGASALILPGLLKSAAWLTPATAIFLALLLLASIFLHLKSREKPNVFVSLILFAFAVFIAYGRWV
jgi:putative oxidoreductase